MAVMVAAKYVGLNGVCCVTCGVHVMCIYVVCVLYVAGMYSTVVEYVCLYSVYNGVCIECVMWYISVFM